jgi:hypothetical protein
MPVRFIDDEIDTTARPGIRFIDDEELNDIVMAGSTGKVGTASDQPSYEERVQSDADRLAMEARRSVERDPSLLNKVLAPTRQFTGTMTSHLSQSLPYRVLGKGIEKVATPIVKNMVEDFSQAYRNLPEPAQNFLGSTVETAKKGYENIPEPVKNIAGIGLDALDVIPAYAATERTAKTGLKTGGKTFTKIGKRSLKKEMKPKDVTALLAGKNVDAGARKLVDDVVKYKIESPGKGFRGISDNAVKKISENVDLGDAAILKKAKDAPGSSVDIDNTFISFIDDLENGRVDAVFGDEARAAELANEIYSSLDLSGRKLTGLQPIEKIPEIKRVISKYAGGIFQKGKYKIETDPLKRRVGELAYLRLKDDLEGIVPEIKQYNQAVHDLLNIETAANEAAKRIGNKYDVNWSDWAILFGGPTAAHSLGMPAAAAGAVPGSLLLGRKALGGGRGPSGMIKVGRGLESAYELGQKKITIPRPRLLGNQRGSIGLGEQPPSRETVQAIADAAERHGGLGNIDRVGTRPTFRESVSDGYLWYNTPDNSTRVMKLREKGGLLGSQRGSIGIGGAMGIDDLVPAIKDPQTGKVYIGNKLYGHKFVSEKGETEAIKNRLQQQYFKDNMTAGKTENVGFVDSKGQFISRQEAETKMRTVMSGSAAQQFHALPVLGATGLTAAGGLVGGAYLKRKLGGDR